MSAAVAEGPPDPLGPWAGGLLALVSALAALGFGTLIPAVSGGATLSAAWDWAPSLGVALAFRVDGLALVFALLITGFGAIVTAYAAAYLKGHPQLTRFFLYLGLFEAGMLGLVLADDVVALFAFWETTTVASFLLVGFDGSDKARRSAWMALLITGAGGLALLAGLVLLAQAAGTSRISEITAAGGLAGHALHAPMLALILLGAFTKSAQFPFHIWLPNAMAAPTPVSAYLHSATMVKAGVYLLARLHPAFSGTDAWSATLGFVGGFTMVMAALLSLKQQDLKLALAYTSMMALGSLVMFLGAEETVAAAAAMTFLVVHALYKASMFLVVGSIDRMTGTREIAKLGGLWRSMPLTSLAAVLAAGSMAGFPPFLGFVGKELKYEGALAIAEEPAPLAAAAVLSNALMVALALTVIFKVVFGAPQPTPKTPREAPTLIWLGPLLLALGGLVCGVAPDLVGRTLVQPAAAAMLGAPAEITLKLWHGVNVPLLMSLATLALGAALHLGRRRFARLIARLPGGAEAAWDGILDAVQRSFKAATRVLQPGSLRIYLRVTFLVVAGVPLIGLATSGGLAPPTPPTAAAEAVAAALLSAIGAVTAALARRRALALGGVGASGTGLALLFLIHGAPDVAATQLLVDVLLLVLVAAVMPRLPELEPRTEGRLGDAAVALLVGLAVTATTLAAVSGPYDASVAEAMGAAALPDAKGRNVVNVVLVDFRALDTFGEIVVVAAAAIAGLALLRRTRGARRTAPAAEGGTREMPERRAAE